MRNLNECQAEVFRRSEQRIKERKRRRNHILMACLPLALCIALFSAVLLPNIAPVVSENAAESDNEMFTDDAMESIACNYTKVEIQTAGNFPEHHMKITDKVEVTKIFSAVQIFFSEKYGAGQGTGNLSDKEAVEENKYLTGSSSKHSDYVIIFSDKEGNQTIYNLVGNILLNMSTNEAVSLTDSQAAGLKEALGLTD